MIDYATHAPKPGTSLASWVVSLFWLGHFKMLQYVPWGTNPAEALVDLGKRISRLDDQPFMDAVDSYQSYNWDFRGHPLKRDGVLGHYTRASMDCRCCMHRDVPEHEFGSGQPRWEQSPTNPVRVAWVGGKLGLIDQAFYRDAAAKWSGVCGISIADAPNQQAADIWARGLRIDGSSNTLAWSHSPGNSQRTRAAGGGRSLEQRYDTGDLSFYSRQGDAQVIITHEIGHALHFDGHTQDRGDIMYPSHTGPKGFGANETRYMQQAYGKPRGNAPTPTPPGDEKIVIYIGAKRGNGEIKFARTELEL